MAVGLVRPMVLVPAAWATENADRHAGSRDRSRTGAPGAARHLSVNLLQRIVETLLFYHPAVWWRRGGCESSATLADEVALSRQAIASSMQSFGTHCQQPRVRYPARAGGIFAWKTHMHLLQRVRNILGQPTAERSRLWPAGVVALALPLGRGPPRRLAAPPLPMTTTRNARSRPSSVSGRKTCRDTCAFTEKGG